MQTAAKTAMTLAATLPAAFAFQESEYLRSSMSPQELSLIDSVGTAPCVFKLGDSFYDYTPIKLYHPAPRAPYFDGQPDPAPMIPPYEFVFGWCQHLDDISSDDLDFCRNPYFAGRTEYEPTSESTCTAYSGGDVFEDIETEEITGIPKTVKRWRD